MTRFPYDQFAKDYLKELLQPLGEVETSRKVPAQIREIDVYFVPPPQSAKNTIELGLLGKFAAEPASLEPFRNAATIAEIRSCMNKLFDIFAEVKRQAKSDKNRLVESDLPRLWILSPTGLFGQAAISPENFELAFSLKLSSDNRWVVLASLIPWTEFEEEYSVRFICASLLNKK
ncbi:hypothetical protein [Nostoc sp. KVJ3]|uniref:hypothetical protein n=1 Tax=Nostoc sp. KVJ3 TaxID=457945 RepID=UPI0022379A9B|nr:hypothetical protein [Nostoc sp. KVJ3]